MNASAKRKRGEDSDSDDEPTYGLRQILPVANLPIDFDGEPTDGMQYLFTVRRETRRLPGITRVTNPYSPPPTTAGTAGNSAAAEEPRDKLSLPSEEWRSIFERHFRNFRSNVCQPTIGVHLLQSSSAPHVKVIPDKKDRDAWWAFLQGAPDSVWNPPRVPKRGKATPTVRQNGSSESGITSSRPDIPEAASVEPVESPAQTKHAAKAREPTPTMLQHIDHRTSVHLLMYFTHWLNLHLDSLPSSHSTSSDLDIVHIPRSAHGRWIFALLARVDAFCTGEEISNLRGLARACLSLARARRAADQAKEPVHQVDVTIESDETTVVANTGERETRAVMVDDADAMSESSIWMIFCAIASIWGQRDLWMDAEGA
ncbi:hypothetical protein FA95DRAFT_1485653 [Auriscalpium vulgare]|uniref:Uncharacterized protein n=1 Tax=Auriscalpium vulgare TaxID=40419 RepID=A0ACB8S694_9AGAM|nr:hypothetical protein FA95DRAFT_1485653 [Auriscalpium vulgare]